mmetsp:Transcript_33106/g.66803  ORF Transcript_33106/g.66803 Transcript_33106/m.66803 type:complete len:125 (-) Transcript_33106:47-421(-)
MAYPCSFVALGRSFFPVWIVEVLALFVWLDDANTTQKPASPPSKRQAPLSLAKETFAPVASAPTWRQTRWPCHQGCHYCDAQLADVHDDGERQAKKQADNTNAIQRGLSNREEVFHGVWFHRDQ